MKVQGSRIPQFKLRILSVRDSYEEIFQSAISGDARSIQYLLSLGRASVRDTSDDSGHSPLRIAARDSRIDMIRVLLQYGAEPYLEKRQQETPYDTGSDNIFYFQATSNASAWRIDEMQIALRKDRSSADKEDADGRTPLSCAAARGDSRFLQLLLNYGAKVDQTDDWKLTCLLAAHYYPDPVCFTAPHLKAGAQVNVRCSQGRCPLMEPVSKNEVAAVKLLLDYRADVNSANNAGATALHKGVRHNSHEALAVLLDSEVDHTLRDAKDRTVLHYAALYADLKTLNTLHHERLLGLNPDDQDVHHSTPVSIAESRQEEEKDRGLFIVNLEWIATFWDLLESLLTFKTPRSVPNYAGSIASEDTFLDALQHLSAEEFDQIAGLAEHGQSLPLLDSATHSEPILSSG